MTLEQILSDIHGLEEDLIGFEQEYGTRSEVFHAAYRRGEESVNEEWVLDFSEWASVHKRRLQRQTEYRKELQREFGENPPISDIIRIAA